MNYRRGFLGLNSPPYVCFECDEDITVLSGRGRECLVIHHVDGDHSNDDPANWAPAHHRCHAAFHARGNKHQLGRKHTPETRAAMSAAQRGIPKSPEHKAKISEAQRGPKNHMFGKTLSAEARGKISDSLIGNQRTLGRKASAEEKMRLSESLRGERHPMFGKSHSEETRARMSAAQRARWQRARGERATA